jgi:Ca2+-binding RTX toxin-like protein
MATVFGTNASEIIDGADGVTGLADVIFGKDGSDDIYGLGGDDLLKGGGGADDLYGGAGNDTADYSDSSEGVLVAASGDGGGFTLAHYGNAEGDRLYSIENVTGSSHGDWLFGNGGNNVLKGLSGNDLLSGGAGADTLDGGDDIDTASYYYSTGGVFVSLVGDYANFGDATGDELNGIENIAGSNVAGDTLHGDNGANELRGHGGADEIWGHGGDDTIYGGDMGDTLRGGGGVDHIYGDADIDYVYGGAHRDYLRGGADGDYLYGEDGADDLEGNDGNDVLDGGADNDTMRGGLGNDDYYVSGAGDVITEGAAEGDNDRVFSASDYVLTAANIESVALTGFAISATGNGEINTLHGNALGNVLNGGGGSDSLVGNGGNDTFVFQAGQAHGDTIYDFTGNGGLLGDSLRFSGYGTAAAGASFVHLGGNDWQVNSADGLVHETIVILGAVDASDYVFV